MYITRQTLKNTFYSYCNKFAIASHEWCVVTACRDEGNQVGPNRRKWQLAVQEKHEGRLTYTAARAFELQKEWYTNWQLGKNGTKTKEWLVIIHSPRRRRLW